MLPAAPVTVPDTFKLPVSTRSSCVPTDAEVKFKSTLLLTHAEPLFAVNERLGTDRLNLLVSLVPMLPFNEVRLRVVADMLLTVVIDVLVVIDTEPEFVPVTVAPNETVPPVPWRTTESPDMAPLELLVKVLAAVKPTELPLPVLETAALTLIFPGVRVIPLALAATLIVLPDTAPDIVTLPALVRARALPTLADCNVRSVPLLTHAEPLGALIERLGTDILSGDPLLAPILPLDEVRCKVVAVTLAPLVIEALDIKETVPELLPVMPAPIESPPPVAWMVTSSPEMVPLLLEVKLFAAVIPAELPAPLEVTDALMLTLPGVPLVPFAAAFREIWLPVTAPATVRLPALDSEN